MTELKTIAIEKIAFSLAAAGPYELRIDWSNDYHIAIAMRDTSPDSVKQALIDAAQVIAKAQHGERL